MPTEKHQSPLATYFIVAGCSLFFCSKGVFAKAAYAHEAAPIDVLAIRMGCALPFFAVVAWVTSRRAGRLPARDWWALAGLGFIGYYISSFVNFTGLQFITVGLERIVLYTYPSLVLLGTAVFRRRRPARAVVIGVMVCYAGILIAFAGEAGGRGEGAAETLLGVALVFASAITYAVFISLSAGYVRRIGAWRFTGLTVGFSCLFILAHHLIVRSPSTLFELSPAVYLHGVWLAIFGTVIPSFLLGIGLRRAGAQKFAVVGTVGPVATFLLAWAVLGESPNVAQLLGFALSLGGGLWVTLHKDA